MAKQRSILQSEAQQRYLTDSPNNITAAKQRAQMADLIAAMENVLEGASNLVSNSVMFDKAKGYLGFLTESPSTGNINLVGNNAIPGAWAFLRHRDVEANFSVSGADLLVPGAASWRDLYRDGEDNYFLFRCVSTSPFTVSMEFVGPSANQIPDGGTSGQVITQTPEGELVWADQEATSSLLETDNYLIREANGVLEIVRTTGSNVVLMEIGPTSFFFRDINGQTIETSDAQIELDFNNVFLPQISIETDPTPNALYLSGGTIRYAPVAIPYSRLTDVDTSQLAIGDFMVWNGSAWVPNSAFSSSNGILSAWFTYVADGLTVDFTEATQGTPTTWAWDFGDGNSSSFQNPTHTYASAGTYKVELTVTDAQGAESFQTRNITTA